MKIKAWFDGTEGCRRAWTVWACIALATFAVHLVTLRISPPVWQDEVQIIDYGRKFLPGGDSSHSISWRLEGRPNPLLSYLGGAVQEVGYRLAGGDPAGPRISTILGALFASAALLGWLRARSINPFWALACAVLFLWDPLFVQGYRGARVDGWAMGWMLAGFWVLRANLAGEDRRAWWTPRWWHLLAGLCVALSGLMWMSAILLVPLLLHELLSREGERRPGLLARLTPVAWVGSSALIFLLLGLVPQGFDLGSRVGSGNVGSFSVMAEIPGLLQPYARSPWVPLAALLVFAQLSRRAFWAAILAGLFGVLYTGTYEHRAVYLLPYFLLALAFVLARAEIRLEGAPWLRFLPTTAAVGLLLWSGALSLVLRPAAAFSTANARAPEQLEVMLEEAVGEGPGDMYLASWELYYAARSLGWRTYFAAFENDQWDDPRLPALVAQMDAALFAVHEPKQPPPELMEALGFQAETIGPAVPGVFGEYILYRRMRVVEP